uniref:GLOBIN domain-containing protein n=1 Tax=Macrostomum lignano TaxID=282301 RepID=A0A1I8GD50_9PLAT
MKEAQVLVTCSAPTTSKHPLNMVSDEAEVKQDFYKNKPSAWKASCSRVLETGFNRLAYLHPFLLDNMEVGLVGPELDSA